jgi:rod shape determining protein RodA
MLGKLKRIDWLIVFVLGCFAGISYLLIDSAIYTNARYQNSGMATKMLYVYGLSFVVLIIVSMVNYRFITKIWYVSYAIGIGLLIAVRYYGVTYNGAKSWFQLADGLTFQPAELMKIILVIAIAGYLSYRKGDPLRLVQEVLPVGLISFIPFFIILIQPDLGNAIIFVVIIIGMLWIGNLKYTYVLISLVAGAILLASFLYLYNTYHDEMYAFLSERETSHWMDRVDTFLDPEGVDDDSAYHVKNSMTAIGSGGLLGDGFKQGNSIHSWNVPLPFSDSIFVVLGEEFGFVGSAVLLLLYFMLIYRMILIAIQCDNLTGALIITGVVSMFVFQIFENVGMLIGIMPLTGITLPFISYGGTSVLINVICLGIVQSIRIHQEEPSPY